VAAVPLGAPDDVEFAGVEPLDAGDEPESLAAPPAKLTLVFPGHYMTSKSALLLG